jgi:small-conductance mechanosensitive channel
MIGQSREIVLRFRVAPMMRGDIGRNESSDMGRIIGRIWAPALLFAVFALGTPLVPDLMRTMGEGQVVLRLTDVVFYVAQIGLWLAGAYLGIRLAHVLIWERLGGGKGRAIPSLVKDLLAIIIMVIAVAGIIGSVFHQSLAGIWATSGAVGIVLGFALRNIILDTFTGLFINLDHSYRIGDWIELMDRGNGDMLIWGKVIEIDWRTTRLESDDKRVYLIPNSRMGTTVVANYSLPNDVCRFEASFVFDFSVPSERVMRVLLAGAKAVAGRRPGLPETPEPSAIVRGSTLQGIEYTLRYWVAVTDIPRQVARHVVIHSALQHLERAGLTPTYPKQDNFLARMPERLIAHQSEADRVRLLHAVEIFHDLTAEELGQLARAMTPRPLSRGATLVREGEQSASMFVLAEGLLEVTVAKDGAALSLARLEPGEFAGEMSLLTGEPRSATIAASTEALVYEITREHLTPILAARPALFEAISQIVAKRRLRTTKTLEAAAAPQQAAEVSSLSTQIVAKMRMFFRNIGHRPGGATAESRART